jgi:hypothetical protein
MSDEEHSQRRVSDVLGRGPLERLQRFFRAEVACQRGVLGEHGALVGRPLVRGELGGGTRAHLGAVQDRREPRLDPCDPGAGDARLLLAAGGQTSLRVRAGSVRLRLGMT